MIKSRFTRLDFCTKAYKINISYVLLIHQCRMWMYELHINCLGFSSEGLSVRTDVTILNLALTYTDVITKNLLFPACYSMLIADVPFVYASLHQKLSSAEIERNLLRSQHSGICCFFHIWEKKWKQQISCLITHFNFG